jgi:hypothetical protein
MLRSLMRIALALPVALLAVACGDSGAGGADMTPSTQPTWPSIYSNIIQVSCLFSSCHNMTAKKGGLDLSNEAMGCANLVNTPAHNAGAPGLQRVTPGDADTSYFYQKLAATQLVSCTTDCGAPGMCITVNGMPAGERMPKSSDALQASDIAVVKQWIVSGAACQ